MYPEVAQIDCRDCKKHSYDLKTGELNTYDAGDQRLPILRHGNPPPCHECPKQSPERGEQLKLSRRNIAALNFYNRAKAVPQMQSKLFQCVTTQRNFRVIDTAYELAKGQFIKNRDKESKDE